MFSGNDKALMAHSIRKTSLTIVIPELAGILQQKINRQLLPDYLTKMKTKGCFKEDESGLARLLMNHFSDTPLTDSDLPVAGLRSDKAMTLCADPCYLHADLDRVLLFSDDLDLTNEESTALIAEIQPLLDDFGATLSQYKTDEWCLELKSLPGLHFSALPDVSGRSVEPFLPKGDDRRDWVRLWNEIQMQLHNAAINQQRQAQGKVPINSLWFWGQGTFKPKHKAWQSVQGQHSLLELLSKVSSSNTVDTNFDSTELSVGSHLWLMKCIDIEGDWPMQLQQLDEQILKPIWQMLRTMKLNQLSLQIPNHGTYTLTPIDSWKFW